MSGVDGELGQRRLFVLGLTTNRSMREGTERERGERKGEPSRTSAVFVNLLVQESFRFTLLCGTRLYSTNKARFGGPRPL